MSVSDELTHAQREQKCRDGPLHEGPGKNGAEQKPRGEHNQDREGVSGRIEWDTYVLYGPEARWSEESSEHVSWGRPLAQEAGRLKSDLNGVFQ